MKNKLTVKQKELFDLYENFIHSYQKIPQYKDVANVLHISTPSLFQAISSLRKKGMFNKFKYCPYCGKKIVPENQPSSEDILAVIGGE